MERGPRPADVEEDRRQALTSLEHLRREPTFAGSSLEAAARRTADHFAGRNREERENSIDPVELWGRRIGRALSLAGCIGLALYLYLSYLR